METAKSYYENHIIQKFISSYPEFPKGKLIKSESPDFILKISPKKTIGIELTRLYKVPDFTYEIIQDIIQSKDEKLTLYRKQKIDIFWLIIIIDLEGRTNSFNINNKIQNWPFVTSFHKLFLFESNEGNVVEVK